MRNTPGAGRAGTTRGGAGWALAGLPPAGDSRFLPWPHSEFHRPGHRTGDSRIHDRFDRHPRARDRSRARDHQSEAGRALRILRIHLRLHGAEGERTPGGRDHPVSNELRGECITLTGRLPDHPLRWTTLLACAVVQAGSTWTPPDLMRDSVPSRQPPRLPVISLRIGTSPIVLENTELEAVRRRFHGTIGHEGEAGTSKSWLCLKGRDSGGAWALWLEASEVSGSARRHARLGSFGRAPGTSARVVRAAHDAQQPCRPHPARSCCGSGGLAGEHQLRRRAR